MGDGTLACGQIHVKSCAKEKESAIEAKNKEKGKNEDEELEDAKDKKITIGNE